MEYWSIGLKGITPYSVTPVSTSQSVVVVLRRFERIERLERFEPLRELAVDQTDLNGVADKLRGAFYAEPAHHLIFVGLDRASRKLQDRCNFFHPPALCDEPQYFALARRQLHSGRRGFCEVCDDVFGYQWRQICPSLQSLSNGGDELLAGRLFQYISRRSGAKSFGGELGIGMHCQEDDFGLASHRFEAAQRFKPAQHRHGNIGDNHVGPELPSGVDQLVAIAYGAHKVEMIFQKCRQTLGDNRVVIGEQHSRTALHRFPPDGTCTRTSVPRCG